FCLDLLKELPIVTEARREACVQTAGGYGEVVRFRLQFSTGVEADITVGNIMSEKRRQLYVYFDSAVLVLDDLAEHRLCLYPRTGAYSQGDFSALADGTPV